MTAGKEELLRDNILANIKAAKSKDGDVSEEDKLSYYERAAADSLDLKAIEKERFSPEDRYLLALCHIQIGIKISNRLEKIEHFKEALGELRTGDPTNPYINHSLAAGAHFSLGNIEEDQSCKKDHYKEVLGIIESKPTALTAKDTFMQTQAFEKYIEITAAETAISRGDGPSGGAAAASVSNGGCEVDVELFNDSFSTLGPLSPLSPSENLSNDKFLGATREWDFNNFDGTGAVTPSAVLRLPPVIKDVIGSIPTPGSSIIAGAGVGVRYERLKEDIALLSSKNEAGKATKDDIIRLANLYIELGPLLAPGSTERKDEKGCYQKAITLLLDNIKKDPKERDYRTLIVSTCDTYTKIEDNIDIKREVSEFAAKLLMETGVAAPISWQERGGKKRPFPGQQDGANKLDTAGMGARR